MRIIAVANQKGGVGKTTAAVTLGHGLARRGLRTLLVDLDPQGHIATSLGLDKSPGLFRLLVSEESVKTVATAARTNLDIIAGDKQTEKAKRHIVAMDFREQVLTDALRRGHEYEVVVLDCASSLDVLHVAALVASDYLLIPTRLDHLAVDGVNQVLRSAAQVKEAGYDVSVCGLLPTFFDRVIRETSEQLRQLVDVFDGLVRPPVPQDTRLREAPAFGQTAWEYAPTTAEIAGYRVDGQRVGGYSAALEKLVGMVF
jgi:chromosome partitioning protein